VRERDYDAVYTRLPARSLDPADDLDFWLSSGALHVWNPDQKTPATEWERQIDRLMLEQVSATNPGRRRELFEAVQRLFAENLPALYFAAPRVYSAYSPRLSGVQPSVLRPFILWNADSLAVAK
jgi:peptide/nickel transport system substrate-binding protein